MIKVRVINENAIELIIADRHFSTKPIELILTLEQGQLHINPKRPANIITLKNYHKDGTRNSIMGDKKYDVLISNELHLMTSEYSKKYLSKDPN